MADPQLTMHEQTYYTPNSGTVTPDPRKKAFVSSLFVPIQNGNLPSTKNAGGYVPLTPVPSADRLSMKDSSDVNASTSFGGSWIDWIPFFSLRRAQFWERCWSALKGSPNFLENLCGRADFLGPVTIVSSMAFGMALFKCLHPNYTTIHNTFTGLVEESDSYIPSAFILFLRSIFTLHNNLLEVTLHSMAYCFALVIGLPICVWLSLNQSKGISGYLPGITLGECLSLTGYSMIPMIPGIGLVWLIKWLDHSVVVSTLFLKMLNKRIPETVGITSGAQAWTVMLLCSILSARFLWRNLWPVIRTSPLVEPSKLRTVMSLWVTNHVVLACLICNRHRVI